MFKISAFSFDARRELFAEAKNRCVICCIRQMLPDTCTATFRYAMFCDFSFSLLKFTKIIHYYFVLHINKILCHNDVPTKLIVTIGVTLIKQSFCSVAKFILEVSFASFWRNTT